MPLLPELSRDSSSSQLLKLLAGWLLLGSGQLGEYRYPAPCQDRTECHTATGALFHMWKLILASPQNRLILSNFQFLLWAYSFLTSKNANTACIPQATRHLYLPNSRFKKGESHWKNAVEDKAECEKIKKITRSVELLCHVTWVTPGGKSMTRGDI